MLIKVFSVWSMPSKLPPGVCWRGGGGGGGTYLLNKGGGSNRLPGLVTKQQAVEFPQVLAIVQYKQGCRQFLVWGLGQHVPKTTFFTSTFLLVANSSFLKNPPPPSTPYPLIRS